jgi:hypothetical protein
MNIICYFFFAYLDQLKDKREKKRKDARKNAKKENN